MFEAIGLEADRRFLAGYRENLGLLTDTLCFFQYIFHLSPSHQTLTNSYMGAAIGDGQRRLARLATATPFIHIQVVANGIDVL
jgi:hypothetical protein